MTRHALSDCVLGPLQRHAERFLWAGRRESTKVSYSGKWMWFVHFCTFILPSEYGMHPRKPLPASVSTVLLYLSHLSQEDEVRDGSLIVRAGKTWVVMVHFPGTKIFHFVLSAQ